ncbi:MAG: LPS export ABC transporter periplasmic protein LptC [Candidatus Omnitrophota bacterium]|nr:MAG: LPS export ABC transporter periplasmic protein LptC [Candidatus Omnitrophota bacterium]
MIIQKILAKHRDKNLFFLCGRPGQKPAGSMRQRMLASCTIFFIFLVMLCLDSKGFAQQRIKDFYLSNYKENGTQDWEIQGDQATVHDKFVDIENMNAKYYYEEDTVSIKSQKAKLDKEDFAVHLEDDVHIENPEGMKLSSDSLDWKRAENKVQTADWVQAQKDEMQIRAKGFTADTKFRNVDFQEDVEVKLPNKESDTHTTITCSGPLEIEYNEGKAVFYNNVVVEDEQGKLFADKATVFFDTKKKGMKGITKIIAEQNVKIIKDENITFAEKATYLGDEGRIVLEGSPRLIYFPKQDETP